MMSYKNIAIGQGICMVLLCVALVVQGFSGRDRRHQICDNFNQGLAVLHDVIVIASTPPSGKKLTVKQAQDIATFQTKAFARIAAARCHV